MTEDVDGQPVPPLHDLRTIAQGAKSDRRLTYRAFRAMSIRITWLLLHTDVTPNQVTVASLVVAAAGLVLTAADEPAFALIGLTLLLAYHLLDRVDGEVARARRHYSLVGVYLDNAGHYLTGSGILVAATFRLAPTVGPSRWVWLMGIAGAVAAAMARVEKHAPFHLFSQYVLERPELLATLGDSGGRLTRQAAKVDRAVGEARRDVLTLTRDVLLTATAFPQTVVAVAAVVVLQAVVGAGAAVATLAAIVAVHCLAYAGVEVANLSQNLAAELRRLAQAAEVEGGASAASVGVASDIDHHDQR